MRLRHARSSSSSIQNSVRGRSCASSTTRRLHSIPSGRPLLESRRAAVAATASAGNISTRVLSGTFSHNRRSVFAVAAPIPCSLPRCRRYASGRSAASFAPSLLSASPSTPLPSSRPRSSAYTAASWPSHGWRSWPTACSIARPSFLRLSAGGIRRTSSPVISPVSARKSVARTRLVDGAKAASRSSAPRFSRADQVT